MLNLKHISLAALFVLTTGMTGCNSTPNNTSNNSIEEGKTQILSKIGSYNTAGAYGITPVSYTHLRAHET